MKAKQKTNKLRRTKYLNLKDRIALMTALDNMIHQQSMLYMTKNKNYIKYLKELRKKL